VNRDEESFPNFNMDVQNVQDIVHLVAINGRQVIKKAPEGTGALWFCEDTASLFRYYHCPIIGICGYMKVFQERHAEERRILIC